MKFFKLLKKEAMELITFQSLAGILVGVVMFILLGTVMNNVGEEMTQSGQNVAICDYDQTQTTKASIEGLKASGYTVHMIEGADDVTLSKKAAELDLDSLLVFPEGFEKALNTASPPEIRIVSVLKSFSMMSSLGNAAQGAADSINNSISDMLILSGVTGAGDIDPNQIRNPVTVAEVTVVADKSEKMSSAALMSFAMQQSIFIPIIVFLLITFATQLNASAIANEKSDKTLETLLSAPVSRLAVLGSKMCASAIFSLLMAAVFMVGFSSYMGGMMGGMTGGEISASTAPITQALQNLGLQLGPMQYALIGVQLFLTISIALTISMILGSLAKDLKSAQSLIAPLMFVAMVPYLVTMLMDIGSLPTIAQVLVYAIPFTHTFTASANILFGNDLIFYGGMLYQVVFLVAVMFFAVRVFSTDKIFTMTLEFKKKRKSKKAVTQE